MATTVLTPNTQVTAGNWTDEAGGATNLHLVIDEGAASPGTDYICTGTSGGAPLTGGYGEWGLTSVASDFESALSATITIRHSRGGVEGGDAGGGDDSYTLYAAIQHPTLGTFVNSVVTIENSTAGYTVKTEEVNLGLNATALAATAADWNDVTVILAVEFSQSKGNDGDRIWVDLVDINVAYHNTATPQVVAWRFRNDNGTETTATWKEAQNIFPYNLATDTNFRIRFRIDDTSSTGWTDDPFRLQYQEGGGTWTNVTASSLVVRAFTSGNFAEEDVTTEQLTGGTGTFQAGEMSEDGLVLTQSMAAGGITELEYCVQLRSADLTVSDSGVGLRLLRNSEAVPFATGTSELNWQIGADLWWAYNQVPMVKWAGPFPDSSGNIYAVALEYPIYYAEPRWAIWKSTDAGTTWQIKGNIGLNAYSEASRSVGVLRANIKNDILYIAWHENGNSAAQEVYCAAWDCSTDTVEFEEELVQGSLTTASCSTTWCSIDVDARSDGTVIVLSSHLDSGGQTDIDISRRTGVATWSTTSVTSNGSFARVALYVHTDDDAHMTYIGGAAGTPRGLRHRVFSAANSLGAQQDITTTGDTLPAIHNRGHLVKAFNKLFTIQVLSGALVVWYSDGITDTPTWNSVTLTNSTSLDQLAGSYGDNYWMDTFGGRVVVAWVEETDQQLYYQQWQNGSSDFAAEVATGDTSTGESVEAFFSMFTASNDVKLAYSSWVAGQVMDLRLISGGAPVDEGGGGGPTTTSAGWWGFGQGW